MGKVKRPLIDLEILENRTGLWYKVEDVLVDTGADVTMMPRRMRFLLDGPLEGGVRKEIKGVVPGARLTVYIHTLRLRFNGHEFESPILMSARDDVFPILGRTGAIDRFLAESRSDKFAFEAMVVSGQSEKILGRYDEARESFGEMIDSGQQHKIYLSYVEDRIRLESMISEARSLRDVALERGDREAYMKAESARMAARGLRSQSKYAMFGGALGAGASYARYSK